LLDKHDKFYFMEMNTRIQVEHPVTEMITGIDLVEQMIRVAAGEKLALAQKDVKLNGWAVESRVYAEDPYRNFLPSIGRLTTYRPPAEGPSGRGTIRNDTGVFEGGEISMYYDPMIAKLVTHAPTRLEAIDLQAEALDAFAISGIQHNIPFLTALMQHPRWREGRLSTGFIAEEYPGGFKARTASGVELDVMAAVAAAIDHQNNARRRMITSQMAGPVVRFATERVVVIGDQRLPLTVSAPSPASFDITFSGNGGNERRMSLQSTWQPGDPVWRGTIDGRSVAVLVRTILNGYDLAHRGIAASVRVYTKREAELAALMPVKVAADMGKFLLCPMPGLIKSVAVQSGQVVKAGDTLAVVEAMKMENVLKAERDGTVKIVRAKAGESLAVDAVILEFA
jgi:propionyl-CoA carboxylase alpha chain